MKFFTRYNPPPSVAEDTKQPSLAVQAFKEECDVNKILAHFRETGSLIDPLHPPTRQPMFGDFTELPDYQGMLDMIIQADQAFMTLPAAVRKRFDNDPQKVIDFLNDESNLEEAVKLGLCNPRPTPESNPTTEPVGSNLEEAVKLGLCNPPPTPESNPTTEPVGK